MNFVRCSVHVEGQQNAASEKTMRITNGRMTVHSTKA
jgi:hypothetical protein